MKRILKVIFIITVIINLNIIVASANEELNVLQNTLEEIGLSSEYSENITNYIKNLSVSQDDVSLIMEDGKKIIDTIGDRRSIDEFNFGELINMYGQVMSIANELDLNLSYSISNNTVTIIDKNSNDVLFSGGISDLTNYYGNLSQVASSTDIVEVGKGIINEIIANNENVDNNVDNIVDSNSSISDNNDIDLQDNIDSNNDIEEADNEKINTNSTANNTKSRSNNYDEQSSSNNNLINNKLLSSNNSNLALGAGFIIVGVLVIVALIKIK